LVEPDRTVKPHLLEVKKVYQYIGFNAVDLRKGTITIENKYTFMDLSGFDFTWELVGNGEVLDSGELKNINLSPGEKQTITIPYKVQPEVGVEYFFNLSAKLKDDWSLVEAGWELANEQFKLPLAAPMTLEYRIPDYPELEVDDNDTQASIGNNDFSLTFDKKQGVLSSFKTAGTEMLISGPIPNFWRAPIDNDFGNNLHKRSRVWRKAGENRKLAKTTVKKLDKGKVEVVFSFDLVNEKDDKIADYQSTYLVLGSGDVVVTNNFEMTKDDLPEIVRMGMNLVMPQKFDQITWLGRGPHESYWDRKTSAFVGLYSGNVADQYWAYLRPQENGNKTDVRWLAITDNAGNGLLFSGMPLLETSAHHNIMEDFESMERTDGRQVEGVNVENRHTTDVKPRDLTSVNIDYKQMGVGGDNSWGATTHPEYRLTEKEYSYTFRMRAITAEDDAAEMAKFEL
jgi:beta-galactosidase